MSKFTEKKIVEVIAYIFNKLAVSKLEYRKLMKLLYLCDRTMYNAFGVFITHDSFKSMKNGPVLVNTDDLLVYSEKKDEKFYFKKYFEKDRKMVSYKQRLDTLSALNKDETAIMDNVISLFGKDSEAQIVYFSHTMLGEWEDPGDCIMKAITPEDIKRKGFGITQ